MQIATSRFHARELIVESGLAPVGITVSPPKWPLPYRLAGNVEELAPYGAFGLDDWTEFERRYRERLDRFGVDATRQLLAPLADAQRAPGVVLLCFENLTKPGEHCHRRLFAAWWQEQTGEPVHELAEPQQQLSF